MYVIYNRKIIYKFNITIMFVSSKIHYKYKMIYTKVLYNYKKKGIKINLNTVKVLLIYS